MSLIQESYGASELPSFDASVDATVSKHEMPKDPDLGGKPLLWWLAAAFIFIVYAFKPTNDILTVPMHLGWKKLEMSRDY